MSKSAKNLGIHDSRGTAVYTRQHSERPTLPQLSAIDLLVVGKSDTETAALLSLNRTTVTKWRLYDPVFQAELNLRRVEVWSVAAERLRSLLPKAVDVIGQELDNPETRLKAALELFRLVPPRFAPIGPTDANEVLRIHVAEERERIRQKHSELSQQKTDELFGALIAHLRSEVMESVSESSTVDFLPCHRYQFPLPLPPMIHLRSGAWILPKSIGGMQPP